MRLVLLTLCLLLTACAELIVRDDDNAVQEAAKVVTRAVLILPTVGISEAAISDIKDREAYEAWRQRSMPHPVSAQEWHAHLFDEKLLALAEFVPDLLIASWIGDYLTLSSSVAAAALMAAEEPPISEEEQYLPAPMRRWNRALDDLPRGPCQRRGPCSMP
ncbi:MAG TPA: hypothetical protein VFA38_11840 [Nitrospirales bacterium]|nr:hypothetical protein [Nitrospirales bacterium]